MQCHSLGRCLHTLDNTVILETVLSNNIAMSSVSSYRQQVFPKYVQNETGATFAHRRACNYFKAELTYLLQQGDIACLNEL